MGKKETKIENAVCEYAEEQGFLVRKYHSIGVRGGPDRILFGHGQCFLIEFKSPDGDLEPWQEREINRIREHGVKVFVMDDIKEGKLIIDGAKIIGTAYVKTG